MESFDADTPAAFARLMTSSAPRLMSADRMSRTTGLMLVAAGFAEYQPLDTGTTEEAYKRNRRIELKLTER